MITIDGIEYTRKNVPSSRKILVLAYGYTLIGDVEKVADGYNVTNASVIRRWGTTEGIGQLAKKDNEACPILDPTNGVTFVNGSQLIFSIDVEV